jgi:hypothetical protein
MTCLGEPIHSVDVRMELNVCQFSDDPAHASELLGQDTSTV